MLKIAIIGAGIGGIATARAISFACPDVSVNVYEKGAEGAVLGHALLLTPNGSFALKDLGLEKLILTKSKIVSASRSFDRENQFIEEKDVKRLGDELGFPFLTILRKDLHQLLLDGLESNKFHYELECIDIEQRADSMILHFNNREIAEADIVLIADGAASKLRQKLFPESDINDVPLISARGLVSADSLSSIDLADGVTYFYREVGKYFVSLSLPNGMRYWNAMLRADVHKNRLDYTQFLMAFENWPVQVKTLMNATNIDEVILRPLYGLKPMSSWVTGRAALVGDAAHVMLPTLGQGANQALMDAVTLAKCIRAYLNKEVACYAVKNASASIQETFDLANDSATLEKIKITDALHEYEKQRLPIANTAIIESAEHTMKLLLARDIVDTHDAQRRVHRSYL